MGRDLQALQIQNNQIQELINKQLKAFADTQKKLAQEREESVLENAALKSENERMKNMVEKEWMDKLQAAKNEAKGMRQENETLKQELKDKLRAAENKAKGMKQENETLKQELELLKNWKSKMNQLKGDLDTLFNMDSAQIQAPSVDPVRTQKNAPPVLRGVNGTSSQGTPSEQPTVRHVQQIVDNSESQPRPQSSPLSRLTNSGGRDARVKFTGKPLRRQLSGPARRCKAGPLNATPTASPRTNVYQPASDYDYDDMWAALLDLPTPFR
ncbi:hypothetical protein E1B28_002127 [Marasmius oreades]|uniref:Uncharacterized protein n=1 Tax=Marasmius oreades TaxID=181124 RepID=A0A9P7RMQ0_9AGAR|nr:uncharacterized protein E1B28_002127 [Marasmius oreades]KAG7086167.1 hypothetical protein E1B28_002127 [Marasmius oreades]